MRTSMIPQDINVKRAKGFLQFSQVPKVVTQAAASAAADLFVELAEGDFAAGPAWEAWISYFHNLSKRCHMVQACSIMET